MADITEVGVPKHRNAHRHPNGGATVVSRPALVLGAIGLVLVAVGEFLRYEMPSWIRSEVDILIVGTLCVALAFLIDLPHLRRRVGLAPVLLFALGAIVAAVMWVPTAVDPGSAGDWPWSRFAYDAWGIAWILGAIGVFLVLVRKESDARHGDSGRSAIEWSYSSLALVAVGMLVYGIGFAAPDSNHNSHFDGTLSVVGPVLMLLALVLEFDVVQRRIGRSASMLIAAATGLWAVKNLARVLTDWMDDPDLSRLFIYGLQSIAYLLGAIACVLVMGHAKETENAHD